VAKYLAKPPRMIIRSYRAEDWAQLWPILRTAISTGDTYAFAPTSTEEEIRKTWVESPLATFVATAESGELIGTYRLQANQPGLGSHVCNCAYVVSPGARINGVAAAMCEHSQAEAARHGFQAMQFNLVVVTNVEDVRLWKRLGFAIVGTLPKAFRHRQLGFVDAHVMYKKLPASHAG
jgi:ribosomal protein S18 acetylase RimI-like enzyme